MTKGLAAAGLKVLGAATIWAAVVGDANAGGVCYEGFGKVMTVQ
ncbi:hypothetical protein PN441_03760 [Spirulina major CS-329]|nr:MULTISPECIES: hypothetical protein [Spirulina]MDB9495148.1 hypothetical protein [Spirulina subsalsa CS-330]MDB9502174.1 hypothetical protein [Spirulina major CS-329]